MHIEPIARRPPDPSPRWTGSHPMALVPLAILTTTGAGIVLIMGSTAVKRHQAPRRRRSTSHRSAQTPLSKQPLHIRPGDEHDGRVQ